jgi:hypothetical protein
MIAHGRVAARDVTPTIARAVGGTPRRASTISRRRSRISRIEFVNHRRFRAFVRVHTRERRRRARASRSTHWRRGKNSLSN